MSFVSLFYDVLHVVPFVHPISLCWWLHVLLQFLLCGMFIIWASNFSVLYCAFVATLLFVFFYLLLYLAPFLFVLIQLL